MLKTFIWFGTVALSVAWASGAALKPDIVYVLADDLGRCDVGFMGCRDIRTPHLDALAASGARLDQFYVQPLCSPTRAALLTGRYPMRQGLQVGVVRPWAQYGLPLDERTLAEALRQAGYTTALVGKWHLGHCQPAYLPTRRGFDHQYGHYNGAIDYFTHMRDGGLDWHRNDEPCHDEGYSTHLIAGEAVRLIQAQPKDKPLFLYVAFNAVHAPHQVPDSYKQPYSQLKEPRRTYAGMVAAMDEAIGQIVAAVDAQGRRSRTLFIFCSDNGGPQPGRVTSNGLFRAGKGTLYEGGVRVCALATWPGHIQPGRVVTEPIHIVDWYPTLVKLAGGSLEQPLPLDGLDIWPVLTEGKPSPHQDILLNAAPRSGALRAGDWKLVVNGQLDELQQAENPTAGAGRGSSRAKPSLELFNLATDPYERTNLAAVHPERVNQLLSRYRQLAGQAVPPKAGPRPPGFKAPAVWGQTP
jgi:arylsulfatase A-like enzyme